MKRLIVCCDGTWQKLSSPYPTNVVKIAQAIKPSSSKDGTSQIVFYDEGVGAGNAAEKFLAKADQILGGAFGLGIDNNIQDAYRFLCLNYDVGDEIYLFGFSRGAYTVRSLAGLINCSEGLLPLSEIRNAPALYDIYRDIKLTLKEKRKFLHFPIPKAYSPHFNEMKKYRDEAHKIYSDRSFISYKEAEKDTEKSQQDLEQKERKVNELLKQLPEKGNPLKLQDTDITLLACWDTVGSLGVPNQLPILSQYINKKYAFHDLCLSKRIRHALHAVAIDEIRKVFDVTHMYRQEDDKQPLNEIWFPGGHGCVGGGSKEESRLSNTALKWMMDQIADLGLKLEFNRDVIEDGIEADHKSKFDNTVEGIYKLLGEKQREIPPNSFQELHESTKNRWRDLSDYRPNNLKKYYDIDLNKWK